MLLLRCWRPSLFRQNKRISTHDYRDGRKDNSHCGFAIFFIFGVGCSWRGVVANGGSWGGRVDNGSSCGVVLKLSNRFFGALAGARFFFGFRPRLLGIGKQRVGTDQVGRSPETIGSTCRNTATPDCFSGSSRSCVEHADAPHPLALLRPRRERPDGNTAAKKCDEFPPPHGGLPQG